VADSELKRLQKELRFKKLQLSSICELSSAMQAQFDVDHVMRIFFSSLMAPLGISRAFYFDRAHDLFRKRGFALTARESQLLRKKVARALGGAACARSEELPASLADLRELLLARQVHFLLNVSDSKRRPILLGLGRKFNLRALEEEDFEFATILSRFMQIELENIRYLAQVLEKKKLEHEMQIARTIQLSLLPQGLPELQRYELAVIYQPIQEVGGDYYDILKKKKNVQPLVLADVEGKGLAAALLAASCQAIFHSMNELYLFRPATFIAKANAFLHEMARGSRFITLFWMLLNDDTPALTYVNAGHSAPYLVAKDRVRRLDAGGMLLGFSGGSTYQEQTVALESGDVICAFTDGVFEAQNAAGEEFGEPAIADYIRANRHLAAAEIGEGLYRRIRSFSQKTKFRDDFTILIVKVR
jgi:serine phosphatase RsbU (regulator of sigma subunit)